MNELLGKCNNIVLVSETLNCKSGGLSKYNDVDKIGNIRLWEEKD